MKISLSVFGWLGPALFWGFVLLVSALHPGYSHFNQYISELGAKEAPFAFLMNFGGIIPFGLSVSLFTVFLWNNVKAGISGKISLILLFLGGVLFVLAGLFRCDEGCAFDAMTSEALLHNLFAMFAFMLVCFAILLLGVGTIFSGDKSYRAMLHLIAGLMAVVCFYIIVKTGIDAPYRGLYQRLFLGVISLWFVMTSLSYTCTLNELSL